MKKQLAINKKTAIALDGSIRKWIKVSLTGVDGTSGDDCPLCGLYNVMFADNVPGDSCEYCPIGMDTGSFCDGTPYVNYDHAYNEGDLSEADDYAKEMLEYLQDLKTRCEVIPGLRQNYVKD